MNEVVLAAGTAVLGWVLFVERRLGRINTIDEKLDLVIELLYAQDKKRGHPEEPGDSGSSGERGRKRGLHRGDNQWDRR